MKSTPKNYKLIEDKECLNASKNNQSVLGKQSKLGFHQATNHDN